MNRRIAAVALALCIPAMAVAQAKNSSSKGSSKKTNFKTGTQQQHQQKKDGHNKPQRSDGPIFVQPPKIPCCEVKISGDTPHVPLTPPKKKRDKAK